MQKRDKSKFLGDFAVFKQPLFNLFFNLNLWLKILRQSA